MKNTRGDTTCRYESEPLYKGGKQGDDIRCSQPQYWCRLPDNQTEYRWNCHDTDKLCDDLGETSSDWNFIIFAASGGVGLVAFMLLIICIILLCKWRNNRNHEKKKEVIDDNFYYGDEGQEEDYYHQTNIVDNNDYYEFSLN